jgi:hypothetical protein
MLLLVWLLLLQWWEQTAVAVMKETGALLAAAS